MFALNDRVADRLAGSMTLVVTSLVSIVTRLLILPSFPRPRSPSVSRMVTVAGVTPVVKAGSVAPTNVTATTSSK